ncbi:hypothetical protein GCM10010094_88980 [Streptomyces flaveus]|uniref:Uncharacterized protein n=1 Tax=Streptomyces flaveus TaxID=66370 RepID=A0A917VU42_9ACTN|nr:hypothetical protein GCM10010094_88980 [Streptomyces flaveus]
MRGTEGDQRRAVDRAAQGAQPVAGDQAAHGVRDHDHAPSACPGVFTAQTGSDIGGEALGRMPDAVPEVVREEDQVSTIVWLTPRQGDIHLHVIEVVADLAYQAVIARDDEGADQGDVRHQTDRDQVRVRIQAQPVRPGGGGDKPPSVPIPAGSPLRRLQDTSADSGHYDDKMLE